MTGYHDDDPTLTRFRQKMDGIDAYVPEPPMPPAVGASASTRATRGTHSPSRGWTAATLVAAVAFITLAVLAVPLIGRLSPGLQESPAAPSAAPPSPEQECEIVERAGASGPTAYRLRDETGLVTSCTVYHSDRGLAPDGIRVTNPRGDPSVLEAVWVDGVCGTRSVRFARDSRGYVLTITQDAEEFSEIACYAIDATYGLRLELAEHVDARLVRAASASDPLATPGAAATPTPTTSATKSPRAGATSSPILDGVVAEFQNPDGPDPADYPPDGYPFFETAHALPTFTRLWIDENQRDVHMALTGDIDGAIEAIGDDVPRGITVYFHVADYSEAELCSLRDAMFDDREELMDRGIVLTSGGCANADNRVNVGISPLTPEAVAYMRARYAGPVHYEDGGASALRPYEPPELDAVELVANRDGQDTGLLTCGRRPFPAAAMDSLPVNIDSAGPEHGALREALNIYVHLYGDLTRLEWLLVERDDYGATFIADRADTWLEALVFAGIEGWVPGTIDYCSPRPLSVGDGGVATVYLDPAFPRPKAAATELHVLVTEEECASGRSPAGRLLPPTVRYDEDGVTITVRIRSAGGFGRCPSNPLLPVTIQLPEPIGDRPLRGIAELPQH